MADLDAFFASRIPAGWFTGPVRIDADDEEILCVGTLPAGRSPRQFRRKVSWGVQQDGATTLFTTLSIPAMTRLRLPERRVLDTLVDGGIARSRSDALAWCVRLVGRHQGEWLEDLRDALVGVERIREEGPTLL